MPVGSQVDVTNHMFIHKCTHGPEKDMYVYTVLQPDCVFRDLQCQGLISSDVCCCESSHMKGLFCVKVRESGQWHSLNERCECCTWDHAVQALDVFLGYSALGAHLVDEAGDEPDHRVSHIAVF